MRSFITVVPLNEEKGHHDVPKSEFILPATPCAPWVPDSTNFISFEGLLARVANVQSKAAFMCSILQ